MLSLSKKTDYALVALAHLAETPGRVASAREIAEARNLPTALLMNILKELQHQGIVRSTRGARGGYELAADISCVSLHTLIVAMEGPVRLVDCAGDSGDAGNEDHCEHQTATEAEACRVSGRCAVQMPLQALHQRFVRFLQEVKLSEVILHSRRLVVPLEALVKDRPASQLSPE